MDTGTMVWALSLTFAVVSVGGGLVYYRLGDQRGWREVGMSAFAGAATALLVVATIVLVSPPEETSGPLVETVETAGVQLPAQAQTYITDSKADLAERLGMQVGEIELDSIMAPAQEDGVYLAKLVAGDRTYEYRWQAGNVLSVSDHLTPS